MLTAKGRDRAKSTDSKCPVPWLDAQRGYLVDWLTQVWVRATGRITDRNAAWLDVPFGKPTGIGESYFDSLAEERGLELVRGSDCGLVKRFNDLSSPSFDASSVDAEIVRFYERTSEYELRLWSEWCGLFRPFGWMIAYTFSRRLQQLNLPLKRLDGAEGIDSELVQLRRGHGEAELTGWFRKYRQSGKVIYVGFYSYCSSGETGPLVRVAFPLPNGCALVMMKPEALPDGSFRLSFDGSGDAGSGFYFVLDRDESTVWVKHVKRFHESIHVWAEGAGRLSAEHVMKLWGVRALRMRYEIVRRCG